MPSTGAAGQSGSRGQPGQSFLPRSTPTTYPAPRRVLAVTACNVAAPVPALAYRVVSAEDHGCARVVWDGPSEHTSGTLLAPNADDGRAHSTRRGGDIPRGLPLDGQAACGRGEEGCKGCGYR